MIEADGWETVYVSQAAWDRPRPERVHPPSRVFDMDGSEHYAGDRRRCHCYNGPCRGCGADDVHSQSIYGPAIVYECGQCGCEERP